MITDLKNVVILWEVNKSILVMYCAVVFYVRCYPGIAQTSGIPRNFIQGLGGFNKFS
jgi:hypothetical protein